MSDDNSVVTGSADTALMSYRTGVGLMRKTAVKVAENAQQEIGDYGAVKAFSVYVEAYPASQK